jgi:hypothetical protein
MGFHFIFFSANNPMKKTFFRVFLFFLTSAFIQCGQTSNTFSKTRRHLVIHGGLSAVDLFTVAKNADYLIVSDARLDYLKQIKQMNPRLILLKYHNALGVRESYPQWNHIDKNEAWFVHDKYTNQRLKAQKYGWYLMNNANASWRNFLALKIVSETDDLFDGVFIDDFWSHFVNKFWTARTQSPGQPSKGLIREWDQNMILILKQLRSLYSQLIFINGAHQKYMKYVDGCMEEGFVHANWHSDDHFPNPSKYLRSLLKIQQLKKFSKTILVQSGSRGDNPVNIEHIFSFCAASYFLVSAKNTSFGFHPLHTYYFKGIPSYDNYSLDLGRPKGDFYSVGHGQHPPNLIPNGNFDDGFRGWKILTGAPSVDTGQSINGRAILFVGAPGRSDNIISEYIPVSANTDYMLSAYCKSEMNRALSVGYKKLGMQGRYYDKNKTKLTGAFDLQFDAGTFDWLPFEITHTSPANAAYFKLRLGFIGDGLGKGWIDKVYFGPAPTGEKILRRDFSNGFVIVNYGLKDATVAFNRFTQDQNSGHLTIKAKEGKILISGSGDNPSSNNVFK